MPKSRSRASVESTINLASADQWLEQERETDPVFRSTVAVTGATGFIARFIVKMLLERGYRVHGSVRNLADTAALAQLRALPNAELRLNLFELDLLDSNLASSAQPFLTSCHALIHTATPIHIALGTETGLTPAEVVEQQLKPAVQGTERLLMAARESGVRRVVLTCSTGCIKGSAAMDAARASGLRVAEDVWTEEEYCIAAGQHYRRAKLLQERRAVEFCAANGMVLDRIHPDLVLGPKLDPHRLNFSHKYLLRYLDGSLKADGHVRDGIVGMVDVRDVALAHIRAAEQLMRGGADGNGGRRYVMSVPYIVNRVLCDRLRLILASAPAWARDNVPSPGGGGGGGDDAAAAAAAGEMVPPTVECGPVEKLIGAPLRGWESVLRDTVETLVEGGWLKEKRESSRL